VPDSNSVARHISADGTVETPMIGTGRDVAVAGSQVQYNLAGLL
jgi:hypothetical protein